MASAALVLLMALPLTRGEARAQDHRLSFTGYLGGAGYSNLAGELDPGITLGSSGFYGGMAELWFGRLGLRLHGGIGRPSLQDDPATGFDIVAGDVDLVARFRRPRADLVFQPYGVVGLGALRYDLSPDAASVGGFAYDADPSTRGTLVLGIGTDLGRGPVAVRLEMMDIIGWSSPLSRVDGSRFEPVSHVVFTFGLSFRAGTLHLPPPDRAPVPRVRPGTPRHPAPADPRPPVADTAATPRDTLGHRPRVPDTPEQTPDTPVDPPPANEPADTTDRGDGVRGRLFTVRVAWDGADPSATAAVASLAAMAEGVGLPLWPPEPDAGTGVSVLQRRVAAFTNAADARLLGHHIQAEYGLSWEWVHIDRDENVSPEDVEASTAFVEGLRDRGQRPGRPGAGPSG